MSTQNLTQSSGFYLGPNTPFSIEGKIFLALTASFITPEQAAVEFLHHNKLYEKGKYEAMKTKIIYWYNQMHNVSSLSERKKEKQIAEAIKSVTDLEKEEGKPFAHNFMTFAI